MTRENRFVRFSLASLPNNLDAVPTDPGLSTYPVSPCSYRYLTEPLPMNGRLTIRAGIALPRIITAISVPSAA